MGRLAEKTPCPPDALGTSALKPLGDSSGQRKKSSFFNQQAVLYLHCNGGVADETTKVLCSIPGAEQRR